MTKKRRVEVFTAGCPLCDDTVKLVRGLSCPSCDVTVYDLNREGVEKARGYGVNSVPAVVVDGVLLGCCKRGAVSEAELNKAGIGTHL